MAAITIKFLGKDDILLIENFDAMYFGLDELSIYTKDKSGEPLYIPYEDILCIEVIE